ncbi:lipase family protein [Shewanella sp. 3_MG-2023]|uniref:lipase family protein n=1 Tax=Shewanella sp. 3_MG-2023 TaxID=3062635 RepID=UPI0026E2A7BC|nr:lipase family protein [Shewanella sp. 3_MG-2023]MDO6775380.1 lipase family protein [Shewanella sp. 3_MG-2023]
MSTGMNTLTPVIAASFAEIAYASSRKNGVVSSELYKDLNVGFSFSDAKLDGVSGSILERVFNHTTGFGCIAKGKPGPFSGDFVLALRGTEKKRDIITDLHCGVSTCANDQPVHAGFNNTFNSLKKQLEDYFLQVSKQSLTGLNIHVVGHSLGGALANLAANWLKKRFKANVKLYTFGAPRVGYPSFALKTISATNNNIYRCVHAGDPVPLVPVWPFVHTEDEYILHGAPTITAKAHSMTNETPGYLHTAKGFRSYAAINKGKESRLRQQVKLDYDLRLQAKPTTRWARKIGEAILTHLHASGRLHAIQADISNTLTVYDKIAKVLADSIDISKGHAADVKGILGHILAFCGLPYKAVELSYKFVRSTLSLMIATLTKMASLAMKV